MDVVGMDEAGMAVGSDASASFVAALRIHVLPKRN